VQLINLILDNRISCSFIETNDLENIIFCRPLEESLNNVSLIQTKDAEFIHNYIEESTGSYIVSDVTLDNGAVYENVQFKIVTIEEGKALPVSTINLSSLGMPSTTDSLPSIQLLEEDYNLVPESVEEEDDFSVLYETTKVDDSSGIIQKVKNLENKLIEEQKKVNQEKLKLDEERTVLEADRRLQKTLEDYKSELLQETFLVTEHQKEILEKAINGLGSSLQEQFDSQQINVGKYLDEISEANLDELKKYQDSQVSKIKEDINVLLSEHKELNQEETNKQLLIHTNELEKLLAQKLTLELESHKRELSHEVKVITTAVDKLVEEKLKIETENIDKLLVNRSGDLQSKFSEDIASKLEANKKSLFEEFEAVSTTTASNLFSTKTEELNKALESIISEHRQGLNEAVEQKLNEVSSTVSRFTADIDGKMPQLEDTIKEINKRIQNLVIEKKNVQLVVDDARKYTDTKVAQVSEEVMAYARRILELGSGGGTVAVQYANGGTMNGNLNVTGKYLSAGVDLGTLFSGGGGGGNQTLSFNSVTAALSISNGNTVSLSALSGGNGSGTGTYSPYVTGGAVGSIKPLSGSNTASGIFSNIGGGTNNLTQGNYSAVVGGSRNTASGNYSFIAGGQNNNTNNKENTFILGSNITAVSANYTYVNNLTSLETAGASTLYALDSIGNGTTEPVRRYHQTDGKFLINSNDGSFGQFQIVNPDVSEISFVFAAAGTVNPEGSVTSSNDHYLWAFGAGTFGATPDVFTIANAGYDGYIMFAANATTGNVGIGTKTPTTKLDVKGVITATGGNSDQWNTSYTTLKSNSANWNNTSTSPYTLVNATSSIQPINGGNIASGYNSVVAGGNSNLASGNCSFVGGGDSSCTTNALDVVVGGNHNCATGGASFVGGGRLSTASAAYAAVVGGNQNSSTGYAAFVGGGYDNNASGEYSSIIGGTSNKITTESNCYSSSIINSSFINGGTYNLMCAKGDCTSGGGTPNGGYTCILNSNINSGYKNKIDTTISRYYDVNNGCWNNYGGIIGASINGGICNCICNTILTQNIYSGLSASSINSGTCNLITNASNSIIAGGSKNCLNSQTGYGTPDYSFIGGGYNNTVTFNSCYSVIGGGYCNNMYGQNKVNYSVIGGGCNNCISGNSGFGVQYAAIGGGRNNNIRDNSNYSYIAAGSGNIVFGVSNAFILGSNIIAGTPNYTYVNNICSIGNVATTTITATTATATTLQINTAPSTFTNPVTASGTFVVVNINGTNKALQLWDYSS